MKRIFIGIPVTPEELLLTTFSGIKHRLPEVKIKWVEEYNFHITLAFLGNLEDSKIEELSVKLKEVYHEAPSFSFDIAGTGIFKDTVIWFGISPSPGLIHLKDLTNQALTACGFEPDTNYYPHLTIGRLKVSAAKPMIKEVLLPYKTLFLQKINAQKVILYESKTKAEGPVYMGIEEYSLRC